MNVTMTHRSDRGRVRPDNEDAVYCGVDPDGRRGYLMVIADGLGGADAGEVASRLAVESVVESYFRSQGSACAALRESLLEANRRVFCAGREPAKTGMGTTCSALVLRDGHACLAHVGDSRIYQLRNGYLQRLTRTHSLWAEQVERGFSPAARAGQNVLTRVIGVPGEVAVDVVEDIDLMDGDRFLLCSDGLWGVVTDPEIAATMEVNGVEASCGRLVGLANERGGPDNVSVIVAELRA